MKNILFVASEGVPFIKTGGLADVVGSLPKCIDRQYYDVRVILPKYTCMRQEYKDMLHFEQNFYMDLHWRNVYVGILSAVLWFQSGTDRVGNKILSGTLSSGRNV